MTLAELFIAFLGRGVQIREVCGSLDIDVNSQCASVRYLYANLLPTVYDSVFMRKQPPTRLFTMGLYVCANEDGPPFYRSYGFWLPVTVYDGILCLLALWYGVGIWMSGRRLNRMNGVYISDSLVKGNAGYFFLAHPTRSRGYPQEPHDRMSLRSLTTAYY